MTEPISIDDRIDELLDYLQKKDYVLRQNELLPDRVEAKQAIAQEVNRARVDELSRATVEYQLRNETGRYVEYLNDRIKALQEGNKP